MLAHRWVASANGEGTSCHSAVGCRSNSVLDGSSCFLQADYVRDMVRGLGDRGIDLAGKSLLIIGPGCNTEAGFWLEAAELAAVQQVEWNASNVQTQMRLFGADPRVRTVHTSASDLSMIADGSVDLIFSFLSLYYEAIDWREQHRAAREMHRVLRSSDDGPGLALLHVYEGFYRGRSMDRFSADEDILFGNGFARAKLWKKN